MTRLSLEERDRIERDENFASDLLSILTQYTKLRAAYPDLSDDEMAHRMVLTKRQAARIHKLLEK